MYREKTGTVKCMELKQEQGLKTTLSQEALAAVTVLQMGIFELKEYVQEQIVENPVIEFEERAGEETGGEWIRKLQWLEAGDRQNKIYYQQEREDSREIGNAEEPGLIEYLLEQLIYMNNDRKQSEILEYLIQCLDERGYFTEELPEIAKVLGITEKEAEKARELLCTMEPAGVGARDLQECLLLQLERKADTELEQKIVREYMEEFSKNQLQRIAKGTGKSIQEVKQARERITGLNPKPAGQFSSNRYKNYIVPDIVVVKLKDYFELMIYDYALPEIVISPYYTNLLGRGNEAEEYIQEKIKQARWLRHCVEARSETLLKLGEVILKRQEAFFKKGKGNLAPLTQKQAAEELGLHPSTISRAVREKYLQCMWGTYPLAFFFSSETGQEGKEHTADFVKASMVKILETEDKKKPYSDRILAEKLGETGHTVSRRTVAKYREALGILDALRRKEY